MTGLELKKEQDGIHIVQDNRGRATGEAFVQFVNLDDTEKALKRNREKIGHRWVGVVSKQQCVRLRGDEGS